MNIQDKRSAATTTARKLFVFFSNGFGRLFFGRNSILGKLFARELLHALSNDRQLRIVEIPASDAQELKTVQMFREKIYAIENPNLLRDIQFKSKVEHELDLRSFHFAAYQNSDLVGSIRVTPHPFEMETITDSLKPYTQGLKRHLELNRLLVAPSHRNMGVGKKLTYFVYLRFNLSEYQGLAAICKKERAPTFLRLGMEPLNQKPINVLERGDAEYFVLASSWHHIIRDMSRYYGPRILKRWLTGKDHYHNTNLKEISDATNP